MSRVHALLPLGVSSLRAPKAPPLVLGYSGGGDSTFLLRALCASGRSVLAIIVDHGLRQGSAADARRAKAIAKEAGADVEIRTLVWPDGPKSSQERARRGRLHALAEGARRAGVSEIHLAHTLDDQAETVLIRLAAQSTWRGLAGMAARSPLPLWPAGRGLSMVRPMLGQRRAAVREGLSAQSANWIDDPANELSRYARVRARKMLAEWETQGLGPARWAALAARFAVLADDLDRAASACLHQCALLDEGAATLDLGRAEAFDAGVRARALGVLIAAVAGAEREPAEDAVERVLSGAAAATLGGAWLKRTKEGLRLTRDPGAVLGRAGKQPLGPLASSKGREVVWDGRLALTALAPGWRCEPDSSGASPLFKRGKAALTLNQARESGLIEAQWLVRERIAHLLWR